jgi:epoxyqueuosine reductase QueG
MELARTEHPAAPADELERVTAEVKALCLEAGADVAGIAPVERWDEYAPLGYRPHDILPGARSAVVVGARGPSAGAWRSPDHRMMEVLGYDFANDRAIHVVADAIEARYRHYAIQAPALPVAGHQPLTSLMLAAVLAGLGTRSFAANIVLNPEYGLLYYSACFTTLPLAYDEMLEQDVCPAPMCVQTFRHTGKTPCMAACPAEEGGCLDGRIGEDGRIAENYFDRERCARRSMNFGIDSFQKALTEIAVEQDAGRRAMMIQSDFFARSCRSVSFFKDSVAQCFECMRVCPIGRGRRKLK